eukprot:scaffold284849_cov28-Tisochrysis_lutea.AAC.2
MPSAIGSSLPNWLGAQHSFSLKKVLTAPHVVPRGVCARMICVLMDSMMNLQVSRHPAQKIESRRATHRHAGTKDHRIA